MMAASTIILQLMCLLLWKEVNFVQLSVIEQQKGFIMADVGDTVTLHCFHQEGFKSVYWYKHSVGDKPEPLASRNKYNDKVVTFSDKFKNDPRFSVVPEKGINHLIISDVQMSDSAMYYCGMQQYTDIQFQEGIMLHVKGSSSSFQGIVQHPPEKSVQPGDSVNLTCTVHTAGAYYCAVASCGEILLDIGDRTMLYLVCCLGVALVISIILVIVLSSIIYKLKWETRVHHGGHSLGSSVSPTNTADQNEDNLHYAAVSLNKKSRPRPQRNNMDNETVYAGVRQ